MLPIFFWSYFVCSQQTHQINFDLKQVHTQISNFLFPFSLILLKYPTFMMKLNFLFIYECVQSTKRHNFIRMYNIQNNCVYAEHVNMLLCLHITHHKCISFNMSTWVGFVTFDINRRLEYEYQSEGMSFPVLLLFVEACSWVHASYKEEEESEW